MKRVAALIILALLIMTLFIPFAQAKTHRYTVKDIDTIARVVYAEARNQPFLGKAAVALTVINRYESGKYGRKLTYITRRSQFAKSRRTNAACVNAVKWAILHRALPSNCYYFQKANRPVWSKKRPSIKRYCRIGAHTFYTLKKAKPIKGRLYIDKDGKLKIA